MRVQLQPAFVLHSRPYRDTSALLDVLTYEYGRVALVAHGARGTKSSSSRKALLQLFTPVLLSWSGKGDLVRLTAAEANGAAFVIPPQRWLSGLYVNELLIRLLARFDPHPELLRTYHEVLARLCSDEQQEPVLRVFEKRLLQSLGYGLVLDKASDSGQPLVAEQLYRYVIAKGPVSANAPGEGVIISGASLLALYSEQLTGVDSRVLRELKRLSRAVIDAQLEGKPLKTRQLLLASQQRRRNHSRHESETESLRI